MVSNMLKLFFFVNEIKESQELKKEKGVESFNYLFDIVSTLVYIFE